MKGKLVLISFLFFCLYARSQSDSLNSDRNILEFQQLVDSLEHNSNYRVFYKEEWVSEFNFTNPAGNQSLFEYFSKLLEENQLYYIITDDEKLIITGDFTVKESFAKQYSEYYKQGTADEVDVVYVLPDKQRSISFKNEELVVRTIGKPQLLKSDGNAVLSGTISDINNDKPIIGAIIYIKKLELGAVTNADGFYSVKIPPGQYKIEYRNLGMHSSFRNILIHSSGNLDVKLTEQNNKLDEVRVYADKRSKVHSLEMGVEEINMKMIKQIPMALGEADVIKSALLLPGVQSVGEATGGFNVRGGSPDQNLVLLDGAPLINTSHFFGFFSAFNSDIVENVTLYKSGVPAKFGGRISSVMDIEMKEGSKDNFRVSGGVNPVAARLLVEGPVGIPQSSFVISARTTYSDWILDMLDDKQLQQSSASFNDLQGAVNIELNAKNKLSLSGYYSKDKFDYYRVNAIEYSNLASTLKWNHKFSPKLQLTAMAILSDYNYNVSSGTDSIMTNTLKYDLNQNIVQGTFNYFMRSNLTIDFGFDSKLYKMQPGSWTSLTLSESTSKNLEKEQALESALHINAEYDINSFISISGGLRYAFYSFLGPGTVYTYDESKSRSIQNITDTTFYSSNKRIASYSGPEFRFAARIYLSSNSSFKLGYQKMQQYIHMISSTTSISPTDIWKLSDEHLKPQIGNQVSFGFYQDLKDRMYELSAETYYKKLTNIVDYKGGAQLLMNEHLETDLLNGNGKAYGLELMLKKKVGNVSGWVSYTYSRVLHKIDGNFSDEKVNGGEYYPASYDKPHDFKFVSNIKISRRLNFTTNLIYNTGRPITYPVAFYKFNDTKSIYYSNRNEYRIPDYLRVDFAMTMNGNLKKQKLNHSSLTFAVYNVLGRRNPYSIYFKTENGQINGYQMSIFGQPVFTITYNFKLFGNASDDF